MNIMLRKKFVVGVIIFAVFSLQGCQKTPEKKAVIDRSQGLPQNSVLDTEKEGTERVIDAPKHWKESIKNKKGFVTLRQMLSWRFRR